MKHYWKNGNVRWTLGSQQFTILRWCGSWVSSPFLNVHVQCLGWCKTDWQLNDAKFWNTQKRSYWIACFASFELIHTLIALISPVSQPYPCWQFCEWEMSLVHWCSPRFPTLFYHMLDKPSTMRPSARRLDPAPGKHTHFWVTWRAVGFLRPFLVGWWYIRTTKTETKRTKHFFSIFQLCMWMIEPVLKEGTQCWGKTPQTGRIFRYWAWVGFTIHGLDCKNLITSQELNCRTIRLFVIQVRNWCSMCLDCFPPIFNDSNLHER